MTRCARSVPCVIAAQHLSSFVSPVQKRYAGGIVAVITVRLLFILLLLYATFALAKKANSTPTLEHLHGGLTRQLRRSQRQPKLQDADRQDQPCLTNTRNFSR